MIFVTVLLALFILKFVKKYGERVYEFQNKTCFLIELSFGINQGHCKGERMINIIAR